LTEVQVEISITRVSTDKTNGDGPDATNTYLVIENGREYSITCRSHRHGRSLALKGQEGSLHIDSDTNRVYRQVVALGGGCGLIINDVVVEGLSPWALSGVIRAEGSTLSHAPSHEQEGAGS
jgi:hypothetical protein